jgi:hypothetical protein
MKRRGTQVARQIRACLDQADRNACVDQQVGSNQADRPRTDNDHTLIHFGSHRNADHEIPIATAER